MSILSLNLTPKHSQLPTKKTPKLFCNQGNWKEIIGSGESKSKFSVSGVGRGDKEGNGVYGQIQREFVERSGKENSRDRIAFFWEDFEDYRWSLESLLGLVLFRLLSIMFWLSWLKKMLKKDRFSPELCQITWVPGRPSKLYGFEWANCTLRMPFPYLHGKFIKFS